MSDCVFVKAYGSSETVAKDDLKKKKFETVWSVRIQYAPPPCIAPLVEIAQMDSIVRDMMV